LKLLPRKSSTNPRAEQFLRIPNPNAVEGSDEAKEWCFGSGKNPVLCDGLRKWSWETFRAGQVVVPNVKVDEASIGHSIADMRSSKTFGHQHILYAVITSKQLLYTAGGRSVIAKQMTLLPVDSLLTPLLLLAGQPGFPPLRLDMAAHSDRTVTVASLALRGVELDLGDLRLVEKDIALVDEVRSSLSRLLTGEGNADLLETLSELRNQAADMDGRSPSKGDEVSRFSVFSLPPDGQEAEEAWTPFALNFEALGALASASRQGLLPESVFVLESKWKVVFKSAEGGSSESEYDFSDFSESESTSESEAGGEEEDSEQSWVDYERRWERMGDDGQSISMGSIPWPPRADKLLHWTMQRKTEGDYKEKAKNAYKLCMLRWHPDKFMGKFGSQLVESEREEIQTMLVKIIQVLNESYTRLMLSRL